MKGWNFIRVLVGMVGCLALVAAAIAADDDPDPSAALAAEASRCLRLPKSKAKPRLGVALLHAKRTLQGGDTKAASKILNKIVRIDPWALEAHLLLAQLQLKRSADRSSGKRAAEKKIRWILEHAETDAPRAGALAALGQEADLAIPAARPLPGTDIRIAIVPIGQIDVLLVKAAAERVARHIKYPVVVQDARLDLPAGGDDPLATWTEKLRTTFQPVLEKPEGAAALKRAGRTRAALQADDAFLRVYRAWLLGSSRWRELSDFDAVVLGAPPRILPPDALTQHLAAAAGSFSRENVKYVGITRGFMLGHDWRGRERPAYGWGGRNLAVASYGRFRATETREKPNWQRLLDRTANQIICVIGNTFEVGKCPDRTCPMHMVFDLKSIDARKFEPCPRCAAILYDHQ